jgi:hypothetical protein
MIIFGIKMNELRKVFVSVWGNLKVHLYSTLKDILIIKL